MLALLALQATIAGAASPMISGDWLVACDERRSCTALSQVPAGAAADDHPLVVLRDDGTGAVLDVPIPTAVPQGRRVALAVDGRTIAELVAPGGGGGLSLPFAGAVASALRRGRVMTVAGARVSLRGLGAVLTTIARVQKAPAVASPPILIPPRDPRPPRLLSRKQLHRLAGKPRAGCAPPATRAYRLDAAHSLLEVTAPCAGAAVPYILGEAGEAQPASFDPPLAGAGVWDPTAFRYRVLLPDTPGRDCGRRRAYAWDGARFQLAEERLIAECRRATYEIATYRVDIR